VLSGTPRTFIGATTFTVRGLSVRDEQVLRTHIGAIGGVTTVVVDRAGGTVTVRASRPVDRADIAAAVARAGFTVSP
jgi:copper chaperone CopZ